MQVVRNLQELAVGSRQFESLDCFCRDQWHAPDGWDATREGLDYKYYPLRPDCGGVLCAAPSTAPGLAIVPATA